MGRALRWLLAAGLVVTAACGGGEDPPVGPVAGDLILAYGSPSPADGAVLILVTGGPISSVTPIGSYRVESSSAGVNATRIVVTGSLVTGDLVRLRVPDVSASGNYSGRVEAAADRNTFALADPGFYTTGIRR
jgi:hypothetical protein